jgi:hypothetical protein
MGWVRTGLFRKSKTSTPSWDGGHEPLFSNGGSIKPAFAKKDKKQTMFEF